MLPSASIQKLERYGQLGLKRNDIFQFVQSSLKDEKQSNSFALTRLVTWQQCLSSLSDGGTPAEGGPLRHVVATEMLVFAASFTVALLQAPYSKVLRGAHSLSPCLKELTSSDIGLLLQAITGVCSHLNSNNTAASVALTESYAQLMAYTANFILINEETPGADRVVQQALMQLLFVACQRFRTSFAKFPVPSLLSVKTAGSMIKNVKGVTTDSHVQVYNAPLLLKLSLVENIAASADQSLPHRALGDSIARVVALATANRATRLCIYFRGEEHKLAQADANNAAEFAVHSFATTPPIANAASASGSGRDESGALTPGALHIATCWLRSLPCIYKAFLSDASWMNMAKEQRRLKLQRDAERRRDQRKATSQGKKATATQKAGERKSNMSSAGSVNGDETEVMSLLDTVGEETRSTLSTLSQASHASFMSFLSVIDAAQVEREEKLLHESADGNTNLALIFLDQLVDAVHQFIESLPASFLASSGLANLGWRQVERLFRMTQDSIVTTSTPTLGCAETDVSSDAAGLLASEMQNVAIDLKQTPVFQFSHDMRYNEGIGYQTLGVLFAKVMSPLLEAAPATAAPDAHLGTQVSQWSCFRSPQQQVSLSACLEVYETVAPQVINMHLRQIISVVASSMSTLSSETTLDPSHVSRVEMLEHFFVRIIERMGKSNGALTLLDTLLATFQTQEDAICNADAAIEAVRINALIRRENIAHALCISVEDCVDVESLLQYLSRLADVCAEPSASPRISVLSFVAKVMQIVCNGLQPTSLTASIIAEKVAELDLALSSVLMECISDAKDASARQPWLEDMLSAVLSLRLLMDRCLTDLGVESLEQYLSVLEETLWQFSTNIGAVVGPLTTSELHSAPSFTESTVCRIVLQRLSLGHSVTTVLGREPSSRSEAKKMAGFVIDVLRRNGSALLSLSLSDWSALAFYAKKKLTDALVPIIRDKCSSGGSSLPAQDLVAGEWASAAGLIFDAVAVLCLESTIASPELPALLNVLRCLALSRATVPRLPQVLSALVHLLLAAGAGDNAHSGVVEDIASLLLLLLTVSEDAPHLVLCGKLAVFPKLRSSYVRFLEDQDDIVQEMQNSAEELKEVCLSDEVAKVLVARSEFSSTCSNLLRLLFRLATVYGPHIETGIDSPTGLFAQAVLKQLMACVRKGNVAALESMLRSRQPLPALPIRKKSGVKRQRSAPDGTVDTGGVETSVAPTNSPTTSMSHMEGVLQLVLEVLLSTKTDATIDGRVLYCIRSLVHQGTVLTSLSTDARGSVQQLCSHGGLLATSDGIFVAIALLKDDKDFSLWSLVEHRLTRDSGLYVELSQTLPEAIAAQPPVYALQKLLHAVLHHTVGSSDSFMLTEGLRCLIGLSRISTAGFKFSSVKSSVKLAVLRVTQHMTHREKESVPISTTVKHISDVLQLLRLPLPQYHGDEAFVDLELHFLTVLPEFLTRCMRIVKGQPQQSEVLNACVVSTKQVFVLLSSTCIDCHVFRRRTHLLAPLVGLWMAHLLAGLEAGVYDGTVTGILTSFLFRISRSLSRSVDLSGVSRKSSASVESQSNEAFGVDADVLMLHETAVACTMFQVAGSYIGVFTRHAAELDFVALDLIKVLQRERLPDVFAHVHKSAAGEKRNLSKNSFADLAFVALQSEEAKNLLKQAVLNASDDQEDTSNLFSAKERWMSSR